MLSRLLLNFFFIMQGLSRCQLSEISVTTDLRTYSNSESVRVLELLVDAVSIVLGGRSLQGQRLLLRTRWSHFKPTVGLSERAIIVHLQGRLAEQGRAP